MQSNLAIIQKLNAEKPQEQQLFEMANQIIETTQRHAILVSDRDIKQKLDGIIDAVGAVLKEVIKESTQPEVLKQHVAQLQIAACKLPKSMQQKSSLNSVSLNVAKACLFILTFSLAASLGMMFYAGYHAFLTLELVTNYLVGMTAFELIPVGTLGLISFGLYKNHEENESEVTDLQQKVAQFGEAALKDADEVDEQSKLETVSL